MRLMLSTIALSMLLALAATSASARGGGGGGGGGAGAAPHVSTQRLANTNGPASADRDKGLARAEDRESAEGLAHGKPTKHRRVKPKQVH